MRNLCQCGCGILLRKDNRTGYQKGHKPCPVCGTLVQGVNVECCSKSCSAKLHWQRNPEMKESRIWNSDRYATREQNRDSWIKNLSESCKGRIPWNKNKKGSQVAWNKYLPAESQPFYGKKHKSDYFDKVKTTNLSRYGIENCGSLAGRAPFSKAELMLEQYLPSYQRHQRIGKYRPDYIDIDRKHVVELFGDYWHCNPKLFAPDFFHKQLQMTAQDKWEIDLARIQYLESLGYSVTIVWESDLEEFIKSKHDLSH